LERDPLPRNWNTTADFLMTRQPERYLSCVERLGAGDSIDKIARLLGVSKAALRCIRDRHPSALEGYREAIKRNLEEGVHLITERMIDSIDKISPNKYMFAVDVLMKNSLLLSGQATARTEHISVQSPEEIQKLFDQLPQVKEI
jgi:hypothetical protein